MADVHFTPAIPAVADTARQTATFVALPDRLKGGLYLPLGDGQRLKDGNSALNTLGIHQRILEHYKGFGFTFTSVQLNRGTDGHSSLKYEATGSVGDIVVHVCSHPDRMNMWMFIRASRTTLLQSGLDADWLPGAPLQKKTIGRAKCELFGRERKIEVKLFMRRNDTLSVMIDLDDDEYVDFGAYVDRCNALTITQKRAEAAIDRLPSSASAFREALTSVLDIMLTGALGTAEIAQGGYSLDEEDVDEIREAFRDALCVVENARIKFDRSAREEQILQIVDEQIDAALPKAA